MRSSFLAILLSSSIAVKAYDPDYRHYPDKICLAKCKGADADEVCTFVFKLNHFASELGYYTVDGCEGVMPVLGMKRNVQYRFIQEDETNYYHPLGFAYEADGAHAGVDELEPGIVPEGSNSSCGDENTCPAPMYINDGVYLGVYSNIDQITLATGDEDFGLDVYEPQFFASPPDWLSAGTYEVALKFEITDYDKDIFYFCHIHQSMSGRIKWVDEDGAAIQKLNHPGIPYDYELPSQYDQSCGTYGIDQFQLPHTGCATEFVCDKPDDISAFGRCIDSMNCGMTVGMTTYASSNNALALFVHQMIPHHQNAVNMAKALLKSGDLKCDDLTAEEPSPHCVLKQVCLEVITGQNHQIQSMGGAIEALGYVEEDDCEVPVSETKYFSITVKKKFDGKAFCLQLGSGGVNVVVKECTGDVDQLWVIHTSGALQYVGSNDISDLCLTNLRRNLFLAACDQVGKPISIVYLNAVDKGIAMIRTDGRRQFAIVEGNVRKGGTLLEELDVRLAKQKTNGKIIWQSWIFQYSNWPR